MEIASNSSQEYSKLIDDFNKISSFEEQEKQQYLNSLNKKDKEKYLESWNTKNKILDILRYNEDWEIFESYGNLPINEVLDRKHFICAKNLDDNSFLDKKIDLDFVENFLNDSHTLVDLIKDVDLMKEEENLIKELNLKKKPKFREKEVLFNVKFSFKENTIYFEKIKNKHDIILTLHAISIWYELLIPHHISKFKTINDIKSIDKPNIKFVDSIKTNNFFHLENDLHKQIYYNNFPKTAKYNELKTKYYFFDKYEKKLFPWVH